MIRRKANEQQSAERTKNAGGTNTHSNIVHLEL